MRSQAEPGNEGKPHGLVIGGFVLSFAASMLGLGTERSWQSRDTNPTSASRPMLLPFFRSSKTALHAGKPRGGEEARSEGILVFKQRSTETSSVGPLDAR